MDLRPYRVEDRSACLEVFDTNIPDFFAPAEKGVYETYLDGISTHTDQYFVAEHDGRIVGAGGRDGVRIRWVMVHRGVQRMGVGRLVVMKLLRDIGREGHEVSTLATGALVYPFYEKLGYRIVEVIKDGFVPGYDRVEMAKKLQVCA